MADLFSQYASGVQFSAGTIVGSATGVSGLNPIVDRLNSIASSDSLVSGTTIQVTTGDHGNESGLSAVNIIYGTGATPLLNASGATIGTLYIQYTA